MGEHEASFQDVHGAKPKWDLCRQMAGLRYSFLP